MWYGFWKLISERYEKPIVARIKKHPIWSVIIPTLCLTLLANYFITYKLVIPMVQYKYEGQINTLSADNKRLADERERLEREISSLKSNQALPPNVQSDTNQTTLYLTQPPNPTTTIKDIDIQGMGVHTAIGTKPGSGINVTGQSVDLQNSSIRGVELKTGIETGDNSPVTTNRTNIEATKGIKTKNNSPVNTTNTNINR